MLVKCSSLNGEFAQSSAGERLAVTR